MNNGWSPSLNQNGSWSESPRNVFDNLHGAVPKATVQANPLILGLSSGAVHAAAFSRFFLGAFMGLHSFLMFQGFVVLRSLVLRAQGLRCRISGRGV